jgi:hypothetical protein
VAVTDTNLSRVLLCCRDCFRAAIEGQENPCIRPLLDSGKIAVIRVHPLGRGIEELFSLRCARWCIALHCFCAGLPQADVPDTQYSAPNCQSQSCTRFYPAEEYGFQPAHCRQPITVNEPRTFTIEHCSGEKLPSNPPMSSLLRENALEQYGAELGEAHLGGGYGHFPFV